MPLFGVYLNMCWRLARQNSEGDQGDQGWEDVLERSAIYDY